jgi:hypothetical protein
MNDELEKIREARLRWQSRLTRAVNAIKKLDAKEKRLIKKAAQPKRERSVSPTPQVSAPVTAPAPSKLDPLIVATSDALDIPAIFRRAPLSDADKAAADAIKTERAELKKRKAAGQAAKRKAKLSGETRQMPLTGKAALEKISGVSS